MHFHYLKKENNILDLLGYDDEDLDSSNNIKE